MKKLNWFQKLLIFTIALLIFRTTVFFKFEVVGSYTSNAEEATLEMPGKGAKITLHRDGTYSTNSFMGIGTYRLKGDRIDLSNKN